MPTQKCQLSIQFPNWDQLSQETKTIIQQGLNNADLWILQGDVNGDKKSNIKNELDIEFTDPNDKKHVYIIPLTQNFTYRNNADVFEWDNNINDYPNLRNDTLIKVETNLYRCNKEVKELNPEESEEYITPIPFLQELICPCTVTPIINNQENTNTNIQPTFTVESSSIYEDIKSLHIRKTKNKNNNDDFIYLTDEEFEEITENENYTIEHILPSSCIPHYNEQEILDGIGIPIANNLEKIIMTAVNVLTELYTPMDDYEPEPVSGGDIAYSAGSPKSITRTTDKKQLSNRSNKKGYVDGTPYTELFIELNKSKYTIQEESPSEIYALIPLDKPATSEFDAYINNVHLFNIINFITVYNKQEEQDDDTQPEGTTEITGTLTIQLPTYAVPKSARDARSYTRNFPYTATLNANNATMLYKQYDTDYQIQDVFSDHQYLNGQTTYTELQYTRGLRFLINNEPYELVKIKSISDADKNYTLDQSSNKLISTGSGTVTAYVKQLSEELIEIDDRQINIGQYFLPPEESIGLTHPEYGLFSNYRIQGGVTMNFYGTKSDEFKFQLYQEDNTSTPFTKESGVSYTVCVVNQFGLYDPSDTYQNGLVSNTSEMPYNSSSSRKFVIEIQEDGKAWIATNSVNDNYIHYRTFFFIQQAK